MQIGRVGVCSKLAGWVSAANWQGELLIEILWVRWWLLILLGEVVVANTLGEVVVANTLGEVVVANTLGEVVVADRLVEVVVPNKLGEVVVAC